MEYDSAENGRFLSNSCMMTYELVVILSPKLSDEEIQAEQQAIRDLIEGAKGKVLREDTWGKRELAYQINHLSHGMYVQIDFEAKASFLDELNTQLRLRESVIRSLALKKPQGSSSTLSDFSSASDEAGSDADDAKDVSSEQEAPAKTVEEAVATPEGLTASPKKVAKKAAEATEEASTSKKKMDAKDLDDLLDKPLEEEVK